MSTILIKTDRKYMVFERNTIISIEKKDRATLITTEQREFVINKSLASFNLDLIQEFTKINRFTIINLFKVMEYSSDGIIKMISNNNKIIEYSVSRKYKKKFLEKFQQLSTLSI